MHDSSILSCLCDKLCVDIKDRRQNVSVRSKHSNQTAHLTI